MATHEISSQRKALYYSGLVLIGAGVLLFISNFFVTAFDMGSGSSPMQPPRPEVPMSDPNWWEKSKAQHDEWWLKAQAKHAESATMGRDFMLRAFGGMALIIAGSWMRRIGSRGWAGSGVVLDPQQAGRDLEPWSRMGGKVLQDALSEVDVLRRPDGQTGIPSPQKQIMIRCQKCEGLNDEQDRYCGECGAALRT
jgi:hypothetical protein